MRVIKLAILSFIFLFILITIISFFIPAEIRISKAINVAAGDKKIFQYVDQLSEWKLWHPALKPVSENDFVILKDGSISVKGTTISVLERKEEEIMTKIVKGGGQPIMSSLKLIHHAEGDSATLQWYMNFSLRWYPWEKFKSLFYENIYGVQMEQGLANLKQLMEARRSSIN